MCVHVHDGEELPVGPLRDSDGAYGVILRIVKAGCHLGGHSSGGRALMTKVRGPQFNPGWLPVFHGSLNIFPSLSS